MSISKRECSEKTNNYLLSPQSKHTCCIQNSCKSFELSGPNCIQCLSRHLGTNKKRRTIMCRRRSSKYGKRNKWWKLLSYNEFCHPVFMKRHSARKRKIYKCRRIFQRKSCPIPNKSYWPIRKKYPAGDVLLSYTDFMNSLILVKDPAYVRDPTPKKIIPIKPDTNCFETATPVIKISSFYQNENTAICTVPFNADSYEPEQKRVCNIICKEKSKPLFNKLLFKRTTPQQKMFTRPCSMTQDPLKYSHISKRKSNTILCDPFTHDSRLEKFYANHSNLKKKCTKNGNKTKLNRYKGVCKRELPIHLNKSIINKPVLPFIDIYDLDDHKEKDKNVFVGKNKPELSFCDFKKMNEKELRIIMSELTQVISGFKVRSWSSFIEDDTCSNEERMIYYNNTDDFDFSQSSCHITSKSKLKKVPCRGIKFFIKPKVSFSKKCKFNFRKRLKLI